MEEELKEQPEAVSHEELEVTLESDDAAADGSNGDHKTEDSTAVAKPVFSSADPEADEKDVISMPPKGTVYRELQDISRSRHVIIHPAIADDMSNEVLVELVRNAGCEEISFQFVRTKDDSALTGVIKIVFCTSKQATEYVPYLQFRPDITVQQAPTPDVASNLMARLKKDRTTGHPQSDALVVVKNLDPASISIEKLAAVFPEADDIVIPKNAEHGYSGKLKGRQHAYLVFKNQQEAAATVENFRINPIELDSYQPIVLLYKDPPSHVPEGFLPLSQRMLVLRQIARFKGFLVRAQEDPMIEVKPEWTERSKHAQELIEKDDAARDELGLQKPSLVDFKDMSNVKNLAGKQADTILFKLNLAEKPADTNNANNANNKKRGPTEDARQQNSKRGRGNVKPLMSSAKKPPPKGFSTGGSTSYQARFSTSANYGGGGYGHLNNREMQYGGNSMRYNDRSFQQMSLGTGLGTASMPRMELIQRAARQALSSMRGGRGGRW